MEKKKKKTTYGVRTATLNFSPFQIKWIFRLRSVNVISEVQKTMERLPSIDLVASSTN